MRAHQVPGLRLQASRCLRVPPGVSGCLQHPPVSQQDSALLQPRLTQMSHVCSARSEEEAPVSGVALDTEAFSPGCTYVQRTKTVCVQHMWEFEVVLESLLVVARDDG